MILGSDWMEENLANINYETKQLKIKNNNKVLNVSFNSVNNASVSLLQGEENISNCSSNRGEVNNANNNIENNLSLQLSNNKNKKVNECVEIQIAKDIELQRDNKSNDKQKATQSCSLIISQGLIRKNKEHPLTHEHRLCEGQLNKVTNPEYVIPQFLRKEVEWEMDKTLKKVKLKFVIPSGKLKNNMSDILEFYGIQYSIEITSSLDCLFFCKTSYYSIINDGQIRLGQSKMIEFFLVINKVNYKGYRGVQCVSQTWYKPLGNYDICVHLVIIRQFFKISVCHNISVTFGELYLGRKFVYVKIEVVTLIQIISMNLIKTPYLIANVLMGRLTNQV